MSYRKVISSGICLAFLLAGWTLHASNRGLAVSPDALFFRQVGTNSAAPSPRRLSIHTRGGVTLGSFTAAASTSSGGNWLSVSPGSGAGNTSLTASVDTAGLVPGIYSGLITVTADGTEGSPLEVPVTLEILTTPSGRNNGRQPELIVQPGKLKFKIRDDEPSPLPRHILIHRPTGDEFQWTAIATVLTPVAGTWLILDPASPASGSGRSFLDVNVDPTNLPEGEYRGEIVVTSGSNTSTVEVELEVESEDADDDDDPAEDEVEDNDDEAGEDHGPRGTPKLLVTPQALNFIVVNGSLRLLELKTLRVRSTGRGNTLPWTASAIVESPGGGNWLSIDPASGDSPGEISVHANPDGLAPGMYSGKVKVVSGEQEEDVQVFLRIVGSDQSSVRVRPKALRFTATPGVGGTVSPPSLPVSIHSDTAGLTFAAVASTASGGNWLAIAPAAGAVPGEITASVDASIATALAPGLYTGKIEVTIDGAVQQVQTIHVTLKVFGPEDTPRLKANPSALSFVGSEGGPDPAAKAVLLRPEGAASIDWTADIAVTTPDGGTWLSASSLAGTASAGAPSAVDISAAIGALPRGVYRGVITFTPTAPAGIPPVQLRVHLIVRRAGAGVSRLSFSRSSAPMASIASGNLIAFFHEPSDGFISQVDAPPVLGVTILDADGQPVEGAEVVIESSNGEPDLTLYDVGNGQYEGVFRPLSSGLVVLTGTADAGGHSAAVFGVYGDVESAAVPPTVIFQHGAVSGASFAPGARPLAPGSIVSLFGQNLGRGLAAASGLPLPDSLDGVSVTVGGRRARLFGISSAGDQINFQLPSALNGHAQADVVVNNNGVLSQPEPLLLGLSPALFTQSQNGRGPAAAQHDSNGSFVSGANPAIAGEVVRLYATGLGAVRPEVADGHAPDGLSVVVGTVTVTIGGIPANVLFSGIAPGFAALYQVNVEVPAGLTPGVAAVNILVDGIPASGQATLHVR